MSLIGKTNEEKIWNHLKTKGLNDYGVAALMGNIYAESSLKPSNLQDTGNRKLGMTDDEYTIAVDNGAYTKEQFVKDKIGYGFAQWTYHTRKKALYEYAKSQNKSIGDLEMQLNFLIKELSENHKSVLTTLKTAKSILEASNAVLLKYECPADQSVAVQNKRASYGQEYYDKYSQNNDIKNEVIIGHKTCKKGKEVKLSNNFQSTEFDCHGNGCCYETIISDDLIAYLQKIRNHFGKKITVTSGYRCQIHNKNIGSTTSSRHTKGDAADIVVDGIAPKEVAKYAESIGIKGIGLYETNADGHFVHVDTRTSKSFWYGQSQKSMSTFNENHSTSNVDSSATVNANRIDTIEEVQNWANDNYKSGLKVDGIYGKKTKKALIKILQTEIKRVYKISLIADGIWGKKTEKACPILKIGTKNSVVKVLQALLICNNIKGVYVDGNYGAATRSAVESYQNKNGLVANGVAKNDTFAKLCN